MIYVVNYTKKNGFMKEPRYKKKNIEGDIIADSRYVKPAMPKSLRNYVPHLHYKKNMFVISMDQVSLDKLVEEIGLYDDNGNIIKTAPLKNPNAPFWKHPDLKISLSGSGTTLDDDIPFQKFWLKCFEADPRFKYVGDTMAPSIASRCEYTITKITEALNDKAESNDETYKAMKLLTSNEDDHEKLVKILRAMGTDVRKPNPKLVRDALLRKITEYKDVFVQGRSERNIEMFIRLAESSTKELVIKDLITKARKRGVIKKDSKGNYVYGDFKLGKNLEEVETTIKDQENVDILNEIMEKSKEKE